MGFDDFNNSFDRQIIEMFEQLVQIQKELDEVLEKQNHPTEEVITTKVPVKYCNVCGKKEYPDAVYELLGQKVPKKLLLDKYEGNICVECKWEKNRKASRSFYNNLYN